MKKFIVLHNLLDIDRYVFPGCNTGIFHRPEEWPKKVKKELSKSEKIAQKHSLKLLKGEINLEEELTKLEIEAESSRQIKRFYTEWGIELHFVKIEELETCEEIEYGTNLERNEIFKDTIEQGNLPLFKANKLINTLEKGLDNLKKFK